MSLKDEIDELEARRVAFTAMLKGPGLTDAKRAEWQDQLDSVIAAQQVMRDDMAADPAGYRAWFLAEGHAALIKKTGRFKQ